MNQSLNACCFHHLPQKHRIYSAKGFRTGQTSVRNFPADDLSLHYGFAVIPARVKKPRDKAKVETAVQVVERWILAPLRNRKFFSPEEINEAMRPLLEVLNNRVMKHLEKNRQELFSTVDAPALKSLPDHPYAPGLTDMCFTASGI